MAKPGDFGSYIPTTNIWDPTELYQSDIDPKLKEILIRMYQNLNRMSLVVNSKETGIYTDLFEFVNSQSWFPNPNTNSSTSTSPTSRNDFRTVINYRVALPENGTVAIPHGITFITPVTFTRIYATATNSAGLTAIPLPFAD